MQHVIAKLSLAEMRGALQDDIPLRGHYSWLFGRVSAVESLFDKDVMIQAAYNECNFLHNDYHVRHNIYV